MGGKMKTDTEILEHIKLILKAWDNDELTDFAALCAVALTVRPRKPVSEDTMQWAIEKCEAHPEWGAR
jgi:hypothetical protein